MVAPLVVTEGGGFWWTLQVFWQVLTFHSARRFHRRSSESERETASSEEKKKNIEIKLSFYKSVQPVNWCFVL